MKRFRKRPTKNTHNQKKRHWQIWNNKLDKHDLTIDLADIKHISKKMFATGYISRKVLKKWNARDYTRKSDMFMDSSHEHKWLPYIVFNKRHAGLFQTQHFWWYCRKCRCTTTGIYDTEVSEPLRNAYQDILLSKKWW